MFNLNSILIPDESSVIKETMCVSEIFRKRNEVFLLPYFTSGENATKSSDRKPQKYQLEQICEEIRRNRIVLNTIKLEAFKEMPEEFLYEKNGTPLASTKERDRRFKIVERLLQFDDELFYPIFGKGPIATVAEEFGISRTNAQRYLNAFYRGGRHKNSLIPSTGRHSSSPCNSSRKLGRPRYTAQVGVIGKNVNDEDKKYMKRISQKYYTSKKKFSLKRCYQYLLDEHYYMQKGAISPDGTQTKTIHLPPNECVSETQFRFWIPKLLNKSRSQIQAIRRQKSDHDANFEARAGHTDFAADGPGDIYQLDSTPLDIELVSSYDRTLILKRVTLYVVRDVFTRSIAGIHIAYGNATWKAARIALFHAIREKVNYAKEYDVQLEKEDWSEHGIPRCLLVDNEEFQNKISSSVGKDLQINVLYGRAYRGDDKGLVESSFHMLNAMLKNENLPGYKYKNLRGRNRNIPLQTACLTAFELQQILIFYAVYHNKHIWKDKFPLEESAMQAGLNKVCREYWDWGMINRNYYLRFKPERQLYLSLLEVGVLTVHKTHLHLKEVGVNYYCEEIRKSGFQNRPMAGTSRTHKTLSCRYIRSNINKILIEFDGTTVTGYLTSEFKSECGKLSIEEFHEWKKAISAQKSLHEQASSGAKSDFSVKTQSISDKAKKAKNDAQKLLPKVKDSVTDRKSASKQLENEVDELENMRFEQAITSEVEFQQELPPDINDKQHRASVIHAQVIDNEDDEFFDLMEGL